jgi:hypothetical protein
MCLIVLWACFGPEYVEEKVGTPFCYIYFDMHLCPFMLTRNAYKLVYKFSGAKILFLAIQRMPPGQ